MLVVAGLWLKRRALAALGLVVLWVGSTEVFSNALLRPLEDAYPPVQVADCPRTDAIVVLGGLLRDERPAGEVEWDEAVDRFERGVALMGAGKADYLVFTAAHWKGLPESEGDRLRQEAIARGIPAERILIAGAGLENTAGESAAIRELVQQRHWRKVTLATSAFHMRRAMYLMTRAGVPAEPFPCDYMARRRPVRYVQDFFPSGEAAAHTERALREHIGLLYYRIRSIADQ